MPPCTPQDIGFEFTPCNPETQRQEAIAYWTASCRAGELYSLLVDDILGQSPRDLNGKHIQITRGPERLTADTPLVILLESDVDRPVVRAVGSGLTLLQNLIGQEIAFMEYEDVEMPFAEIVDKAGELRSSGYTVPQGAVLRFRIALPPGKGIECNQQCTAGTYLAPPMRDCGFCPQGTHSVPGDMFGPWEGDGSDIWPASFHTRCYATDPDTRQWECTKWGFENGVLTSGDQPAWRRTVTFLNIIVDIKTQPAMLRLSYKMELESSSAFYIIINEKLVYRQRHGKVSSWIDVEREINTAECNWKLMVNATTPSGGSRVLSEACIYRNKFLPYTEAVHFPNVMATASASHKLYLLNNDGCGSAEYDGHDVTGKLVVVLRDTSRRCHFNTKGLIAQDHGAAGVIVADIVKEEHLYMMGSSDNLTIPIASISLSSYTALNKTLSDHNGGVVEAGEAQGVQASAGRSASEPGPAFIQILLDSSKPVDPTVARKVLIKQLTIEGTKYAADSCTPCPAGTRSSQYGDSCVPCPANTFASAGSSECEPCPEGRTSSVGSGSCIKLDPCTVERYLPIISPCRQGRRSVGWLADNCKAASGVAAPKGFNLSCGAGDPADCIKDEKGLRRGDLKSCEPCRFGYVPKEGVDTGCDVCLQGSTVYSIDEYAGFNKVIHAMRVRMKSSINDIGQWDTQCVGDTLCTYGGGWRLQTDVGSLAQEGETPVSLPTTEFVVGPLATPEVGEHILLFSFEPFQPGEIVFSVSRTSGSASGTAQLVFTLETDTEGDQGMQELEITKNLAFPKKGERKFFRVHYLPGKHKAKWSYTANGAGYTLHSMSVTGTREGNGVSCTTCPAGYKCLGNTPEPCGAGAYRSQGSPPSECLTCPAGQTPSGFPATGCRPCGHNLVISEGAHCVPKTPDNTPGLQESESCALQVPSQATPNTPAQYHLHALSGEFLLQVPFATEHTRLRMDFGCPKEPGVAAEEAHRRSKGCAETGSLMCATDDKGGDETAVARSILRGEVHSWGLSLLFEMEARCAEDPLQTLVAQIDITCAAGRPVLASVPSSGTCFQRYTLDSPAGCMDCEYYGNVSSSWSHCSNGRQKRLLNFGSAPSYCFEKLSRQVDGMVRDCVEVNFVNSPLLIPVLLAALGILLVGVGAVVRLYKKHRLLNVRYHTMSGDGREMDDEDTHEDTGVEIEVSPRGEPNRSFGINDESGEVSPKGPYDRSVPPAPVS
eukprot:TRINITY_DN15783_c0_g1_i1.p1 TRINITY_DN15783_c0_g1~~TRINITY_DN15783_c0_g1_i1.p1  ORF type:complete len:1332 (+),score=429.29 TRINITY_DN15783_c0_g1_i1:325-3996(+)